MAEPTYTTVCELIGEPAALVLCERFGGIPLYIPLTLSTSSPLVLAIGRAHAALLCERFAASSLTMPSATALAAKRRRAEVRAECAQGTCTLAEIARRHGITVRHVRRLSTEAHRHG